MSKPEAVSSATTVPALEARVLSSVRWVVIGQAATQAGRLVVSIILARLLTPSEFGLMAMAAVITTVASLLQTLGMREVLVQRKEVSEEMLRTMATLGVVTGLALSGILAVGALSAATTLFAEPRAGAIVAVLGLQFAIHGLAIVPESLLLRDMRLSWLVTLDVVHLTVSSTIALILALNGWGVWALVSGTLISIVVRTAAILIRSPWPVRLGFDRHVLRGVWGFGAGVMGVHLVNYVGRFADRLAIGRFLGATNLGLYDYAVRLYWYPMEVITPVLISVMFPALSKVQDDDVRLGRAFLRSNGLIAFVACPLMIGLAAVADPFVPVLLGERWRSIVPLVEILAPAGMLAALSVTTGELFYAKGRAGLRLWWALISALVTLAAVVIGVAGGIRGVAIALAGVRLPLTIVAFALALRLVRFSVLDLWRTVRSPLILAVIMGAAVAALRYGLLQTTLYPAVTLVICVIVGIVLYVCSARLHPTEAARDFHRLLPASLQQRPFVAWFFEPILRRA